MKIAVFKIFSLYMFNIFCELKSSLVCSKRVLLLTIRIECLFKNGLVLYNKPIFLAILFSVYLISKINVHLIKLQGTLLIPLFLPPYHLLAPWEANVEDHLFYLAYGIENTLFCQRLMKVYLH